MRKVQHRFWWVLGSRKVLWRAKWVRFLFWPCSIDLVSDFFNVYNFQIENLFYAFIYVCYSLHFKKQGNKEPKKI